MYVNKATLDIHNAFLCDLIVVVLAVSATFGLRQVVYT